MKHLAGTLVACLIAFTVLAMAIWPAFQEVVVLSVGPLPIYIFDVLVLSCIGMLLYATSLHHEPDDCPTNRPVLWLIGAYLLYQVLVVAPVAHFYHGVSLGAVFLELDGRLAWVFVPFLYHVGLRHMSRDRVVRLVIGAALLLLVYAAASWVTQGPQGYWEDDVYRLRILWGGSSLLFGWLVIMPFLYLPSRLFSYLMGIGGIAGIALVNMRSAYVALACAVAVALLPKSRLRTRAVAVIVAIAIAALLLATVSPVVRESAAYSVRTMFNPYADRTSWDRVERSQLAWEFVKAYPLGDYVWNDAYYLVDLGRAGFEPHNFIIQTLDRQGVIGAALLFATLAYVVRLAWRNRGRDRLTSALLAYLVFYLVYCSFNTNFWSQENAALLPLTIALILDANRSLHAENSDDRAATVAST